jgi:hypothetical protein
MFQNGLLVTFIPEILMVIGYVLCLFAPGFTPHNASVDQTPGLVHVLSMEQQKPISVYKVTYSDFQNTESVPEKMQIRLFFVEKAINNTSESNFSTSDGLSYVDFSRPPPESIS